MVIKCIWAETFQLSICINVNRRQSPRGQTGSPLHHPIILYLTQTDSDQKVLPHSADIAFISNTVQILIWYTQVTSLGIPNTGIKTCMGNQPKLTTQHVLGLYIGLLRLENANLSPLLWGEQSRTLYLLQIHIFKDEYYFCKNRTEKKNIFDNGLRKRLKAVSLWDNLKYALMLTI